MRNYITYALLLVASTVCGQKYLDMIAKGTYKFSEIQQEAENYFAKNGTDRGSGYKQWKRWEYVHSMELDENGYVRSEDELATKSRYFRQKMKAKRQAAPESQAPATSTSGNWKELGPTYKNATSGWNPGVGRVTSIGVDVNNLNHIIVGGNTGGIWKTTDGGSNWTPLADNHSTLDVSSCEISPHNSNFYLWGASGQIYKSTDGGANWTATNMPGSNSVVRILFHPSDQNIIYAAADYSGLYKSTDGGNNWTAVSGEPSRVLDVEFKSDDPNTLIVSGTAVARSTNGGSTWTTISGFSTGTKFIGVTDADPNRIYVCEANGGQFGGFYKSTNGGVSFTKLSHTKNYFGYSDTGNDTKGQAPRDQDICVSPTDADEVHIAGIHTWKSFDGGTTFSLSSYWTPSGAASRNVGYNHADIDILKYHNGTIYVGSDGGIYTSTDKATSFTDKSTGLGIRQFYKIGIHRTDVNLVSGGAQDNGTSVMYGANRDWKDWLGADGMESFVDWNNTQNLYGTSQSGSMYRSTNQGNTRTSISKPGDGTGNWVTPFEQDPQNAGTIYVAYEEVYKTSNNGSSWSTISNFGGGHIEEMKIARSNNQVIWIADGATLKKTTNGGTSWTQLSGTSGSITEIAIHPSDENRVAVSTSSTVYVTTDGGSTWTNYKKNLPSVSLYCVQWQNNANNGLYVGGLGIIMYIEDGMTNWIDFMTGLPNVRVYELEINETAEKIFAGTYGRGLWESDVYGAVIADEEVELVSLLEPTSSSFCSLTAQSITPKVKLKNNGGVNLTSAVITVKLDNNVVEAYNYSGNLGTGGTEDVTLSVINGIGAGNHTLDITVSLPNGKSDSNSSNNDLTFNFSVSTGKSLVLEFTMDGSPNESSWEIKDNNNITLYSQNYNGKGYTDGQKVTHDLCLPDGCYDLIVTDAGSDGLTNGSNGNFRIYDAGDNSELLTMGNNAFGASTTNNFCVNTTVYSYDAAVLSFSGVSSSICGSSTSATVKIKNAGSTTLTAVDIKIYDGNTLIKTINHSTNLAQGGTEDVNISGITFASGGAKTLKAEVSNPNGQSDQYNSNDSKTTSTTVTIGDLHEFYIADRSYKNSLTWEIKSGNSVVVDNSVSSISKTGNDQIQEFCLAPGCYDFVITDAFTTGGCNSTPWSASSTYLGDATHGAGNGEVVSYNGKEYRAQWWTQGDTPGSSSVWLLIGDCNVTYDTDYYGVRKKGDPEYFEVLVKDYTSPKTDNFCNASDLTVDFSADKTSVQQCETVTFTHNITGGTPNSVSWDFGTDAIPPTATGLGPHTVKYSSVGTKTVVLDADGTKETKNTYITVTANNTLIPSVSITLDGNPTCENENISFSNQITNEGSNTTFSWKVNNSQVSTVENYTFTNLKNGDKVKLEISTEDACGNTQVATSNEITMSLTANVTPTVSIALQANNSWPMCVGGNVMLDASTTNEGSGGIVTWYVNNSQVGQGSSYQFSGNDGDKIMAKLNSSETCVSANDVSSNEITAQVSTCVGTEEVEVLNWSVYPNPASDLITIDSKDDVLKVRILDIQSRVVDIVNNFAGDKRIQVNVNQLVPGTYIVELTKINGEQLYTEIQVK